MGTIPTPPTIVAPRFLGGPSASGHSPSSAVTLAPGLVSIRSGHSAWYLVVTWHSRWVISHLEREVMFRSVASFAHICQELSGPGGVFPPPEAMMHFDQFEPLRIHRSVLPPV